MLHPDGVVSDFQYSFEMQPKYVLFPLTKIPVFTFNILLKCRRYYREDIKAVKINFQYSFEMQEEKLVCDKLAER